MRSKIVGGGTATITSECVFGTYEGIGLVQACKYLADKCFLFTLLTMLASHHCGVEGEKPTIPTLSLSTNTFPVYAKKKKKVT